MTKLGFPICFRPFKRAGVSLFLVGLWPGRSLGCKGIPPGLRPPAAGGTLRLHEVLALAARHAHPATRGGMAAGLASTPPRLVQQLRGPLPPRPQGPAPRRVHAAHHGPPPAALKRTAPGTGTSSARAGQAGATTARHAFLSRAGQGAGPVRGAQGRLPHRPDHPRQPGVRSQGGAPLRRVKGRPRGLKPLPRRGLAITRFLAPKEKSPPGGGLRRCAAEVAAASGRG